MSCCCFDSFGVGKDVITLKPSDLIFIFFRRSLYFNVFLPVHIAFTNRFKDTVQNNLCHSNDSNIHVNIKFTFQSS